MSIDWFMGEYITITNKSPPNKDLEKWAVSGQRKVSHSKSSKLPIVRPLARMIIPMKESKPGQLTNLWQYFLQAGNLKLPSYYVHEVMKNWITGSHKFTIPWNSNKMSALGISCLTQDNLAHKKTSHKQTLGTGAAIPKKGISSGNCLWNLCQILPKSNTKWGKRPESE